MRKFRFRFEQVLHYRRIRETLAQERFAEALSAYLEQKALLLRIQQHQEELFERLSENRQGTFDIQAISAAEQYRSMLETALQIQCRKVQDFAATAEEKRQVLVEALKNRKIMEKMKDQERADYMSFVEKLEQQFLDEIATARFYEEQRSEAVGEGL